jgi:hypothetical protein
VLISLVGRSGSRYGDACPKGHFSQDLGRLVRGRPFFRPHVCRIEPSSGAVGRSACRFVTGGRGFPRLWCPQAVSGLVRWSGACQIGRLGDPPLFLSGTNREFSPAGVRWRRNWVAEKSAHKRRPYCRQCPRLALQQTEKRCGRSYEILRSGIGPVILHESRWLDTRQARTAVGGIHGHKEVLLGEANISG